MAPLSEEQFVRILKEVEARAEVAERCRKYVSSELTDYASKSKYAGMDVSQLRRLKELEGENAKLKKDACGVGAGASRSGGRDGKKL